MKVHEIGTYSSPQAGELRIFMLEHYGGIEGSLGHRAAPAVLYNMERRSGRNFIFWPDWLSFAHAVNSVAGEVILDPMCDPAEELGLTVATGLECPDCGCRMMDTLEWIIEAEEARVFCHGCEEAYQPGEK